LTGRFFHVTILPIGDGKKTLFVKRHTRHASHHYHKTSVALLNPSRFSSLSPGGGKQRAKKSPPNGGRKRAGNPAPMV
jgi:hypothetical protein